MALGMRTVYEMPRDLRPVLNGDPGSALESDMETNEDLRQRRDRLASLVREAEKAVDVQQQRRAQLDKRIAQLETATDAVRGAGNVATAAVTGTHDTGGYDGSGINPGGEDAATETGGGASVDIEPSGIIAVLALAFFVFKILE